MKRPQYLSGPGLCLLLIVLLVAWWAGSGLGVAENLKVERPDMQLYEGPNFSSTSLGPVPVGTDVTVLSRSGDWVQVRYQDKTGWLHKLAFPQGSGPGVVIPGLLTGGPVQETKSDEVALAGKGFTPEVEAGYRQKNPSLNYAAVDQVERFTVSPTQLAEFKKEGGLTP